MGELVGSFAALHGPLLVRNWDAVDRPVRDGMASAFAAVGSRIRRARPDVLVVVSPDHWVNFFIDNYPAVCLGVGATHAGPPEPWMGGFPFKQIGGHPAFATHLAATALAAGFEPSLSHRLALDHGFCIPLWKAGLDALPAIVPMIVNSIEPPLPSFRRCYAWGELIAQAAASYPGALRVAVLGTGGLSHSIGEPTMGAVYEGFDRACIERFASASPDELCAYLEQEAPRAGNGSAEIRNWVVAHGAAHGRGFELLHYRAVPQWYVGAGIASWTM